MSLVNCPAKIIKLTRTKGNFNIEPEQPPIPTEVNNQEVNLDALMQGGNTQTQPDLNEPHPDPTMAAAGITKFVKVDGASLLSNQDKQMMNNQIVNSIDHKCKVYTSSLEPTIVGSGGSKRRRKRRSKHRRNHRNLNRRKNSRRRKSKHVSKHRRNRRNLNKRKSKRKYRN